MRVLDALVFGLVAGGLHLGAFVVWTEAGPGAGHAPGGQQGAASISVQAAPAHLAALAERWDTAPAVQGDPPGYQPAIERARPAPPDVARTLPPVAAALPTPVARPAGPDPVAIPQPTPEALRGVDSAPERAVPQVAMPDPAPRAAALPTPAPRMAPPQPAPPAPMPPVAFDTTPPTPSALAPVASLRPETRPLDRTVGRPVDLPQPRTSRATPAEPPSAAAQAAAQAATLAAGSGATPRAAQAAPAKPQQSSVAKATDGRAARALEAAWGAQIQAKVQRSARAPQSGPAAVRLVLQVAPSGKLVGVQVTRGSGSAAADTAALAAVKRARRFPAAPKELTRAVYSFQVTLRFQ